MSSEKSPRIICRLKKLFKVKYLEKSVFRIIFANGDVIVKTGKIKIVDHVTLYKYCLYTVLTTNDHS